MQQGFQNALRNVMPAAVKTGLFSSLCSFYSPSTEQGPTGNFVDEFLRVPDLFNIPCMNAPFNTGTTPGATEEKTMQQIKAESWRHVLLDGYYPLVSNALAGLGWRVNIDGTWYELLGAESDSQRTQTRLRLQRITL